MSAPPSRPSSHSHPSPHPAPPPPLDAAAQAVALLRTLGAEAVPHPGGTLLAHLWRVRGRLAGWQARPALQLAGLCHAFYGTDGFPQPLLPLDRRPELTSLIGPEAEAVVYAYAACDRPRTYPGLPTPGASLHDRFTGGTRPLNARLRRDLAELTAANELDLAHTDPAFRTTRAAPLLALFTSLRPLLTPAAWQDCETTLSP
ncbi:DUF6817 domain-containing protein [Streptomyces sp. NPDC051940]|uniref:DUF6817 domain-containing protein n=1 Tax=Streptomyces sp. NPDC051940 TaxID=3155675 RepID=UPI00341D1148